MGGSTKTVSTAPRETAALRGGVTNYLMGNNGAAGGYQGPSSRGGLAGAVSNAVGSAMQRPGMNAAGVPTGGQQPAQSPYDRINAAAVAPMEQAIMANVPMMNAGGALTIDPSMIPQVGGYGGIDTSQFNRQNIGNASAGQTTSIDALGGANSAFFKNMMAQLQPSFDQARSEAVAAGREGSGNLTGSGFANTLGSHLNRSMGEQQARLADYAVQGLGMENTRQLGQAGYDTQASIANQNRDMGFLQQMLGLGQLGQQGQMANQEAMLRGGMANQATELARLQGNQGTQLAMGQTQAQIDAQRNQTQYSTQADLSNANAQRFMQMLMSMSTAGLGPEQVVQSGGAGALLAPVLGGVGMALGGPIGGAVGSGIGGLFGGRGSPAGYSGSGGYA